MRVVTPPRLRCEGPLDHDRLICGVKLAGSNHDREDFSPSLRYTATSISSTDAVEMNDDFLPIAVGQTARGDPSFDIHSRLNERICSSARRPTTTSATKVIDEIIHSRKRAELLPVGVS